MFLILPTISTVGKMKIQHLALLNIILLFLVAATSNAQYANCTPDPTVTDPEGDGERYPRTLPLCFIGEEYACKLTITPPPNAQQYGFNWTITKIQITSLENLPFGLSWNSNSGNDDDYMYSGEWYCILVNGTPYGTPGIREVDVYANAWIRLIFEVQAPGNPNNGGSVTCVLCNSIDLDLGSDVTITNQSQVTFDANQNDNYHTYLWQNGTSEPTFIANGATLGVGVHDIIVTVSDTVGTTGSYTEDISPCFKKDTVRVTVIDENYIALQNNNRIKIFPNPATDKIILNQTDEIRDTKIEIYAINGILMYSTVLYNKEEEIDISNFSKGLYFIKLTGPTINDILKITVE